MMYRQYEITNIRPVAYGAIDLEIGPNSETSHKDNKPHPL
jgi:hypothetical protein